MNIVFAYFGKSIPSYLLNNLNLHAESFPNHKVWLITNSNHDLVNSLKPKVYTFQIDKYIQKSTIESIFGRLEQDSIKFRDGYWQLTISRILALYDFQQRHSGPLLHVEGDVLLLNSFPFQEMLSLNEIAYPLVNQGYACASTLYSPNFESFSLLNDFIMERLRENNSLTDMIILGQYQQLFPDRVSVLPSAPPDFDEFQDWVSDEEKSLLSSNVEFWGGIFDGLTLGQFLLGEDPRNHFGIRPIYRRQPHFAYAPHKSSIRYIDHNLYLETQPKSLNVYSLHVHSKDQRAFKADVNLELIEVRVGENKGITRYEVIPSELVRQIPKFVAFRIMRIIRRFKNFF